MPRAQASIQAFGRISKPHSQSVVNKKRKADPESEERPVRATLIQDRKKRCIRQKRTPVDSPTRAIGRSLAELEIARLSPTPVARRPIGGTASTVSFEETPPTSPCPSHETEVSTAYPTPLDDFTALNNAMLAALSIHYAHHGTASPLDINQLLPSVTRIWGKRAVTTPDVKRCIGMLEMSKSCPFQLFDYGNGKICIELQDQEAGPRRVGAQFDQDVLHEAFDQELRTAWARAFEMDQADDPIAFIDGLPQAKVLLSPNASKTAQSIALKRGQKRLEEVLGPRDEHESDKQSKRRRTHATEDLTQTAALKATKGSIALAAIPAQARAASLFDRIQAKQMYAASLPAGPCRDQLDRIAALQRVEEVISILNLLVAAKAQGPRASFPLASLVQSIQNSLRSPTAREEVERCLRVMETEVAVGYVRHLKMGGMSGVVVDTGCRPRKDSLVASLRAAGIS